MVAAALEAADLWYRRRSGSLEVLRAFDFHVETGEVVAILGASGSGKSSLLRVLAGLETLKGGTVSVLGGAPRPRVRAGRVALASQDAPLLPWRDTTSNARLPLDLLGRPRREANAEAAQLLERLRIDAYAEHRPGQLSEGQSQRLRLAQALSTSPDLLLLDEPFNSSDEGLRSALTDIVSRFVREAPHRSAILVTHFAFEAAALADRIMVVTGPPLKVIHRECLDTPPALREVEYVMRIAAAMRPHLLRAQSEYAAVTP